MIAATISRPAASTHSVTVNADMRRLISPPKKSATPQHAEAASAETIPSKGYGESFFSVCWRTGGGGTSSTTDVIVSCPAGPTGAGSVPTASAGPRPRAPAGVRCGGLRGGALPEVAGGVALRRARRRRGRGARRGGSHRGGRGAAHRGTARGHGAER